MNIKNFKHFKYLCSYFTLLILLSGCIGSSKKEFQALSKISTLSNVDQSTDLTIRYCPAQGSEMIAENLFLVAVDFSGSNKSRSGGCFIGTDEANKRLYELIKFVQTQTVKPGKSNLYIAIIPFGTKASQECYRIFNNKTASFVQYTLTDPKDIQDKKHEVYNVIQRLIDDVTDVKPPGYEQFIPETCMGWTNYLDTLKSMGDIKKEFMNAMKAKYPQGLNSPQSMVFINGLFLSDGDPQVLNQIQDDISIFSSVSDFVFLNNDKSFSNIKDVYTFLSTGFYTKPYTLNPGRTEAECPVPASATRTAIRKKCKGYESTGSRLCDMSDIGRGAYYDLQANPNYADFKMATLYNSYTTDKIIVTNDNAHWELQNNKAAFTVDTDGDGLSDAVETYYSSGGLLLNPLNPDSDSDGIRDSMEFYLDPKIGVSVGLNCGIGMRYVDTDLDGLYDCEEQVLGLNSKVSDENINLIPDWIDWVNNIQVTTTNSSANVDGDGLVNLDELYQNLPINIANQYLPANISKQTESTVFAKDNNACRTTTIKNFRVANLQKPFIAKFWYYARQSQGSLKQLIQGQVEIKPGEKKTIDSKDYIKGVAYEGN